MIRKWPYITLNKINTPSIQNLKIKSLFLLKIFKKNTRFQKHNQQFNTSFTRKLVIIKKRRTNWNKYVFISSFWVKNFITSKKLINSLQYKLIYLLTSTYPNVNMLISRYKHFSLIGVGNYPLNYISTKLSILKLVYILNSTFTSRQYKYKHKIKYSKLINISYFNSLTTANKLINMGYFFQKTNDINKNTSVFIYKILLNIILNKLQSLRFIQTLLTLYYVNK